MFGLERGNCSYLFDDFLLYFFCVEPKQIILEPNKEDMWSLAKPSDLSVPLLHAVQSAQSIEIECENNDCGILGHYGEGGRK